DFVRSRGPGCNDPGVGEFDTVNGDTNIRHVHSPWVRVARSSYASESAKSGTAARQPLPPAFLANNLIVVHDDFAAAEGGARKTRKIPSLNWRPVGVGFHLLPVDLRFLLRVNDHNVRVAADGNGALARIQPHDFR